jgi:hypothetical protein
MEHGMCGYEGRATLARSSVGLWPHAVTHGTLQASVPAKALAIYLSPSRERDCSNAIAAGSSGSAWHRRLIIAAAAHVELCS